jgi:CRP-like cAMP-binding protein
MYYGGEDGIPCGIYTTGSFFGEIELLTNTNRNFSTVTLTPSKILLLSKKDFQTIFFKRYPRFGKAFQDIMEIRYDGLRHVFDYVQKLIVNQLMQSRQTSMNSMNKINPFHSKYSTNNTST